MVNNFLFQSIKNHHLFSLYHKWNIITFQKIIFDLFIFSDADPDHPDYKTCQGVDDDPICGTNLKTYPNLCAFKNATFIDPSIHIKYNGSCDGIIIHLIFVIYC